jgi:NAD(P)H-nitrite reductase large subunit
VVAVVVEMGVKTTNANTNNTKREIDADFIVLGTGVRPNSEIARYMICCDIKRVKAA